MFKIKIIIPDVYMFEKKTRKECGMQEQAIQYTSSVYQYIFVHYDNEHYFL